MKKTKKIIYDLTAAEVKEILVKHFKGQYDQGHAYVSFEIADDGNDNPELIGATVEIKE